MSIVGRFLEHTRIFYFRNGGEEEYYIGSADCMKRNLESRVEVVTPVEAPELQPELREYLDVQLNDQRGAWDMQSDGTYVQRTPQPGADARSAQAILIDRAAQRVTANTRSPRRRRQTAKRQERSLVGQASLLDR